MILGFRDKGHGIVLMMDANEASGHSFLFNKTSYPATHQRGSTMLSFVLVSSCSVSAVAVVSMQRYLSNHRALVVDLHRALVVDLDAIPPIVPPEE
jgi:hypothetical protein